jgi:sensor domain CHASE-containing protein
MGSVMMTMINMMVMMAVMVMIVVVVMVNGCLENSIQENIRLDLFHEPYLPV